MSTHKVKSAGAPDPACRSGLSTVCPGDEVGPAAFDAGAPNLACRLGLAVGLEAKRRWGPPAFDKSAIREWLIDAVVGAVVGVLSGFGSAAFLHSLTWATRMRTTHTWVVWLLPIAGLIVGISYATIGAPVSRGANLVIDESLEPASGIPVRMAPIVLLGATVTHFFGGSGGREGAAVQIAAGLSSPLRSLRRKLSDLRSGNGATRRLNRKVDPKLSRAKLADESQRQLRGDRVLLIAAIAGGFGSVFGVPFAGVLFALEVRRVGHMRAEGLIAAITASFLGDLVARRLGIKHVLPKVFPSPSWSALLLGKYLLLAVAFALAAYLFVELTHAVRDLTTRLSPRPWLRPVIGGIAVLLLMTLIHTRAYLGLSLPLIDSAVAGATIVSSAWLAKLVFTAITIGSGFPGGEVTPLFGVGACLGSVLAGPLELTRPHAAALGFVAVFAAASNTPIACSVLAVEVFGPHIAVPVFLVALAAAHLKGHRSVYSAQRREKGPLGLPWLRNLRPDRVPKGQGI
jgi:H+/Cl- antiporter ClcA